MRHVIRHLRARVGRSCAFGGRGEGPGRRRRLASRASIATTACRSSPRCIEPPPPFPAPRPLTRWCSVVLPSDAVSPRPARAQVLSLAASTAFLPNVPVSYNAAHEKLQPGYFVGDALVEWNYDTNEVRRRRRRRDCPACVRRLLSCRDPAVFVASRVAIALSSSSSSLPPRAPPPGVPGCRPSRAVQTTTACRVITREDGGAVRMKQRRTRRQRRRVADSSPPSDNIYIYINIYIWRERTRPDRLT